MELTEFYFCLLFKDMAESSIASFLSAPMFVMWNSTPQQVRDIKEISLIFPRKEVASLLDKRYLPSSYTNSHVYPISPLVKPRKPHSQDSPLASEPLIGSIARLRL